MALKHVRCLVFRSTSHVVTYLQETYLRREQQKEEMDKRGERMVANILVDFPCLQWGIYVFEELRSVLGKTPTEMKRLFQQANTATEVLTKMLPEVTRKVHPSTPTLLNDLIFLHNCSQTNLTNVHESCNKIPFLVNHLFFYVFHTGSAAGCGRLTLHLQRNFCGEEIH